MGLGDDNSVKIEYSDEETLFSDLDYVKNAIDVFTDTEEIKYQDLSAAKGIEIKLTDRVKKKISRLIPPEAMPSDDYLRLSPDRAYCMKDMQRCMQNELAEAAWPATQYLWKLHPIFNWIEDKAGIFYKRNEVPVLGLPNSLQKGYSAFVHPEGVFNDPAGALLRVGINKRLKYRFQFANEYKLFVDIKDYIIYCLNVYIYKVIVYCL